MERRKLRPASCNASCKRDGVGRAWVVVVEGWWVLNRRLRTLITSPTNKHRSLAVRSRGTGATGDNWRRALPGRPGYLAAPELTLLAGILGHAASSYFCGYSIPRKYLEVTTTGCPTETTCTPDGALFQNDGATGTTTQRWYPQLASDNGGRGDSFCQHGATDALRHSARRSRAKRVP